MGINSELLIQINADTKNAVKAFDNMRDQTKDLEGQLSAIARTSAIAFAALTAEVGFAVHAFADAEASGRKLNQALQVQGIFTKDLADQYRTFASIVQEKTGIDDDAIIKAQATAQAYLGQLKVTQELTQAIADLAAGTDGDLNSAAEKIARTAGTQTNAFARQGLVIDDTADKSERLAKVLDFVNGRYKDQAAAANQGLGALTGLKTAIGNLQEALGEQFAPTITVAIKGLTEFIKSVTNNKPLIEFEAKVLAAGIAMTGALVVIPKLISAVLVLRAAFSTGGIAIAALSGPLGLLAIALTAAAVGFGYFGYKALEAKNGVQVLEKQIVETSQRINQIETNLKSPFAGLFKAQDEAELAKLKSQLQDLEERKRRLSSATREQSQGVQPEQDPALLKAAQQREAREAQEAAIRKQRIRAENEVLVLQNQDASQQIIEAKQAEIETLKALESEQNSGRQALLQERLDQQRAISEEQAQEDLRLAQERFDLRSQLDADLAATEDEKQSVLRAKQLATVENQAISEQQARTRVAVEEQKLIVASRNQRLEDEVRYGKALADIAFVLRSKEVQATKDFTGELVQLANSKNGTLKAIGKAAAIANITIATAESAVVISQKVIQALPFPVNIPIAAALAAARIAYGAEQISNVAGAAKGALVGGSGTGDTQPFMLTPGELVAPKRNFEEVVGGVQSVRNSRDDEILAELQAIRAEGGAASQYVINGDVLSDSVYIDALVRKISDAFEFRNAKIVGVNA